MNSLFDQDGAGTAGNQVSNVLRSLLHGAPQTSWAAGLFEQAGDLVEWACAPNTALRAALDALCAIEAPETADAIQLRVTGDDGHPADCLTAAASADGGRHLALALFRPSALSAKVWSAMVPPLQAATRRLARIAAADPGALGTRLREVAHDEHPAYFVLTPEFEVLLHSRVEPVPGDEISELLSGGGERLPLVFERTVRRLTSDWNFSAIDRCSARAAFPLPGLLLSVAPMRGAGILIGVSISGDRRKLTLGRAAAAFHLSLRERQVLHELLDGRSIADIACKLHLAESTINDYIARLIEKTKSRNRIEMAATMLGWPAARSQIVS